MPDETAHLKPTEYTTQIAFLAHQQAGFQRSLARTIIWNTALAIWFLRVVGDYLVDGRLWSP
jgi:hypothetical protein